MVVLTTVFLIKDYITQSMKRIPSGAQERYRLLVSDGQWSSSFAMLATQLNSKVASGEVSNLCIIRMNRYVCNTVQENKKVRKLGYNSCS